MNDSTIAILAGVAIIGYLAVQSQKQVEKERERTQAAAKRSTGEKVGGAVETVGGFIGDVVDFFD